MILHALLRQGCGRGALLGGTLWGGGAVIRLGRWFRSIRKKSPPFSVWSARNTSKIAADWSIPLQKSCSAPKEACTFCMIPVWDRQLTRPPQWDRGQTGLSQAREGSRPSRLLPRRIHHGAHSLLVSVYPHLGFECEK